MEIYRPAPRDCPFRQRYLDVAHCYPLKVAVRRRRKRPRPERLQPLHGYVVAARRASERGDGLRWGNLNRRRGSLTGVSMARWDRYSHKTWRFCSKLPAAFPDGS